jgi:hypothetical protein
MNAPTADSVHLLRDIVLFAHWTADEAGTFHPTLIVPGKAPNSFELVTTGQRRAITLTHTYHWDRAETWDDKIIVPADNGVAILSNLGSGGFAPERAISESFCSLTDAPGVPQPEWVFDARGLLAWIPWQNGKPGGNGVHRFLDGNWTAVEKWPKEILHIMPLLDGSVTQIIAKDDGTVDVVNTLLEPAPVDEKHIEELVNQLSDLEANKRRDAYNELVRFGPGAWPVLERLKDIQSPDAQMKLEQLLSEREKPTLGGFKILGNKLTVLTRQLDSSVILNAPSGIEFHEGFKPEPTQEIPAFLSIRPGRAVEVLANSLSKELSLPDTKLTIRGDEWVISDPIHGPRRFLGNHFEKLLPKDKIAFTDWVGTDRRGRWVFREDSRATAQGSANTDASTRSSLSPEPRALIPAQSTLILDPTLADPSPRLPAWNITVDGGMAGWDADDFPAVKRGGAWSLQASGWKVLDESKRSLENKRPEPRKEPASAPTTLASTNPTTMPALLLTDSDGTQFFDGTTELLVRHPDHTDTHITLPPSAIGPGPVALIRAADHLFLFNQPGRVIRLTDNAAHTAVTIDATFTKGLPAEITRVWKDPANRIVIASHENHLTILFPEGHIPAALVPLVPPEPAD